MAASTPHERPNIRAWNAGNTHCYLKGEISHRTVIENSFHLRGNYWKHQVSKPTPAVRLPDRVSDLFLRSLVQILLQATQKNLLTQAWNCLTSHPLTDYFIPEGGCLSHSENSNHVLQELTESSSTFPTAPRIREVLPQLPQFPRKEPKSAFVYSTRPGLSTTESVEKSQSWSTKLQTYFSDQKGCAMLQCCLGTKSYLSERQQHTPISCWLKESTASSDE